MLMFIYLTQLLAQGGELTPPGVGSAWEKYGLPGLIIGFLFFLLWSLYKSHHSERDDWRKDMKELATNQNATNKEVADKFVALHRETIDKLSSQPGGNRTA